MGTDTAIEWAHHTYNPWIGCTKISPACDHCYAAEWDKRYNGGEHWGAGVQRKRTSIQTRNAPYRWARKARETGERPRVFCCSLADVFDHEVPREWRTELFRVILDTPELDWLLLTKRIGNAYNMSQRALWANGFHPGMNHSLPDNVWLGITVVTQAEADRDIPKLLNVPAAVRWLSMEPLLECVDLTLIQPQAGEYLDVLDQVEAALYADEPRSLPAIDWVVAGGESGPGARPMHPDWVRSLRDQCGAAGVPFLFKQWGEYAPACHHYESGDVEREEALEEPHALVSERAGRWHVGTPGTAEFHDGQPPCDTYIMHRVGKKAAGRQLDGVTHDEFPEAVPTTEREVTK